MLLEQSPADGLRPTMSPGLLWHGLNGQLAVQGVGGHLVRESVAVRSSDLPVAILSFLVLVQQVHYAAIV
jgi:hypothetical protein